MKNPKSTTYYGSFVGDFGQGRAGTAALIITVGGPMAGLCRGDDSDDDMCISMSDWKKRRRKNKSLPIAPGAGRVAGQFILELPEGGSDRTYKYLIGFGGRLRSPKLHGDQTDPEAYFSSEDGEAAGDGPRGSMVWLDNLKLKDKGTRLQGLIRVKIEGKQQDILFDAEAHHVREEVSILGVGMKPKRTGGSKLPFSRLMKKEAKRRTDQKREALRKRAASRFFGRKGRKKKKGMGLLAAFRKEVDQEALAAAAAEADPGSDQPADNGGMGKALTIGGTLLVGGLGLYALTR